MALTRWNKIWIVATLCSLLVYQIRWLYGVFGVIYQGLFSQDPISFVLRWNFWVDYVLNGLVGNSVRVLGVALALFSAYLIWGPKRKPFSSVNKKVAQAILFEGIYYLTLLPITIMIIIRWIAPVLMTAYVVQILLVSPFLVFLSLKIWRYKEPTKASIVKWACIASLAYLTGMWVNNLFRWFEMASTAGISFILTGITAIGFLSAAVTLSLSLIFAVLGSYFLLKKNNKTFSIKLFGAALVMLGLHFLIFILYSVITHSLSFLWLTEIWPVTLLGLGIGMLKGKM